MLKILLALLAFIGGCFGMPADKKTDEIQNDKNVFENLTQKYVPLKKAVIDSDFPEPDLECHYPMRLQTKAELLKGTISQISIDAPGTVNYEERVYVDIDGHKTELWLDSFEGADVVDLDITDNLQEIALYANGPSDDPSVTFIRYDGNEIHFIQEDDMYFTEFYGYFDADEKDILPTYGAIWVNQKGRMITSFQNIGFTDKRIALGGYEIGDDGIARTVKFNKLENLPRKYKMSGDFQGFFTPQNTKPQNMNDESFYLGYNMDNMTKFKKGEDIEIIDYEASDSGYYSFYVCIDGQKGVLNFWTGD